MSKLEKCLCCFDITLAARLIGFTGLTISLFLVTVLINDHNGKNFDTSKTVALALGLDWQHFYFGNTSFHSDPRGKVLTTVVLTYSVLHLVSSMMLILSTVILNRYCTAPWLIFEVFSCVAKCIAIFYHIKDKPHNCSDLFIVGSGLYVALTIWWWHVVFTAQTTWDAIKVVITSSPDPPESKVQNEIILTPKSQLPSYSIIDSPHPYIPNHEYGII